MALEQTQAGEHSTPDTTRVAHTATREIGGDAANQIIAQFDQATADGDFTGREAFAIGRAIDDLSASERQDFYRAFSERFGDNGKGTAEDQALLYDALTNRQNAPGGPGVMMFEDIRQEYVEFLTEDASKEARVAFVEGVADKAAGDVEHPHTADADIAAGDAGRVMTSLDGERYALRQAYDALSRASGDGDTKNPALTNVMRVGAGVPNVPQEAFVDDLIATFRETLGSEEQDQFRKAGIFESATRVLEADSQWLTTHDAATPTVEAALNELAQMVGKDGPKLVDQLESSYGEDFSGGLEAFFKVAIREGSDTALKNASAVLAALRAPVDSFVAELQRIHDNRGEIDNAEALLEEAKYVIDPELSPAADHQWQSEFFHSLYDSDAVGNFSWAAGELRNAVGELGEAVDDKAALTNRVAGIANFSTQYMLPTNPAAALAVDVSTAVFQEVVNTSADKVQAHNEATAAELAHEIDMLRNPGVNRDDPPPLNPMGQTATEAENFAPGKNIDPDPIAHEVFQLFDDLKNRYEDARGQRSSTAASSEQPITLTVVASDQSERPDQAQASSAEANAAQALVADLENASEGNNGPKLGELRAEFVDLNASERKEVYQALLDSPDALRAFFDTGLAATGDARADFVATVSSAAPRAQLATVEALARDTTESQQVARTVGDIIMAMEPKHHRGGTRTTEVPMAESLAPLVHADGTDNPHGRLRAVLEAQLGRPEPGPRGVGASNEPSTERIDNLIEAVDEGLGHGELGTKTIVFDQGARVLNDNSHELSRKGELDAMSALGGMLVEGGNPFMAELMSGNQRNEGLTDLFEVAFNNLGEDSRLGSASGALIGAAIGTFKEPLNDFVDQLVTADANGDQETIKSLARSLDGDAQAADPFLPQRVEHLTEIREAVDEAGARVESAIAERQTTLQNITQTVLTGITIGAKLGGWKAAGVTQSSGGAAEAIRQAHDDVAEDRAEAQALAPGDPSEYDTMTAYLEAATRPQTSDDKVVGRDDLSLQSDRTEAIVRELIEDLDID